MPFINGRFYMNRAYGRAIERARTANQIWSEEIPGLLGFLFESRASGMMYLSARRTVKIRMRIG